MKQLPRRTLAVIAAVALLLNAWIHFRLAVPFDANPGTLISQGGLFRIQAVVNVLAAVLLVVRLRGWTALFATAVASAGAAAILLTALVPLDGTAVGLPYLFEPGWYPAKQTSLVFQLAAAAIGAVLVWAAVRGRLRGPV